MVSTHHATHESTQHGSGAKTSEGERLEREMWEAMKAANHSQLEKKIAEDFQSIHRDGPRNRQQELELIKNLKLGNFTLSNFKAKEHGDIITVTYTASANETIDDRHLSEKSSPRMSVWRRDKHHQWQWIAHANLESLGKKH